MVIAKLYSPAAVTPDFTSAVVHVPPVKGVGTEVPKMLMNVLNYKFLLLTRMGEGLFKYIHVTGFERFLHGVGQPIRNSIRSSS